MQFSIEAVALFQSFICVRDLRDSILLGNHPRALCPVRVKQLLIADPCLFGEFRCQLNL